MGRILLGIISVMFLFAFSSVINTGIKNMRTDVVVENDANVTTGAGITSANITLDRDLYIGKASSVLTISSNNTDDDPAAIAYIAASDLLTVSGLEASESRTLTTTYYADKDDEIMAIMGPFLPFLIYGGILGAIGYGIWRKFG